MKLCHSGFPKRKWLSVSELWKCLGKWIGEKVSNTFRGKPPPQQSYRLVIQADELTLAGKNISFVLESGSPSVSSPKPVIQLESPNTTGQILDKNDS